MLRLSKWIALALMWHFAAGYRYSLPKQVSPMRHLQLSLRGSDTLWVRNTANPRRSFRSGASTAIFGSIGCTIREKSWYARILDNFNALFSTTRRLLKRIRKELMILALVLSMLVTPSLLNAASKPSISSPTSPSIVKAATSSYSTKPVVKTDQRFSYNSNDRHISETSAVLSRELSPAKPQGMEQEVVQEVERSWKKLTLSLEGVKLDAIIMLVATSAVIPLFKLLNVSPIVGFLLTGTLIGPGGLNWVKDIHMIDILGEMGIVFFLFEMGLELSLDRLKAMRKDVFGLGTSQFVVTSAVITGGAMACGLSLPAAVTVGGSLALSSSAFVLQLLKDKNAMGTRYGKSSFGILLLQDLAVVPLLVIVELLGEGGAGLGKALALAGAKAVVTLSMLSVLGKRFLDPIFSIVAKSRSQEAFLSIILSTVFIMSFVTQGIGLSDTLGAFLAGILLSETSYRYQIEADISVFRGFLLGLFFMTVGFNIDVALVLGEAKTILLMLLAMIGAKASIITVLALAFGVPLASAQQCGLLNSQAGEFAFVSLGIADRMGLLPRKQTKLLLTTVAISMGITPLLADLGAAVSKSIEKNLGFAHYVGKSKSVQEVKKEFEPQSFVFLCGYGRVGKLIADMLDRKFIRYIALDNSPQKAIAARNKGLPVYYGDVNRPEMLKHFHIGDAKACIITFDDITSINKAVIRLRKVFPELPIIARAKNPQHQQRLQSMFDNVYAVNPAIPEDSMLLMLPFGGAVLNQIGVSPPEVDAILEELRKDYMDEDKDGVVSQRNQDVLKFADLFRKRDSTPAVDSTEVNSESSRHSSGTGGMYGGVDTDIANLSENLQNRDDNDIPRIDDITMAQEIVGVISDSDDRSPIIDLVATSIVDSVSNIDYPGYVPIDTDECRSPIGGELPSNEN